MQSLIPRNSGNINIIIINRGYYLQVLYTMVYNISKDFAKQRYNTPYACNVI